MRMNHTDIRYLYYRFLVSTVPSCVLIGQSCDNYKITTNAWCMGCLFIKKYGNKK